MTGRGLNVGGRAETLAFPVNSVCILEETTGASLKDALSSDFTGLRALVWCGLIASRPGITMAEAGDIIDNYLSEGGNLDTLCDALCGALDDAGFFRKAKRT